MDYGSADLRKVGALGTPHGSGAQAQNDSARDQSVELRIELSGNVSRVAENGDNHGPFHCQFLDH